MPNERSPKLATWNLNSTFGKKKKKRKSYVTPIIDSSLMCEEGRSRLNADQTRPRRMTREPKKKYISARLSRRRRREKGSFSLLLSVMGASFPPLWQSAAILSCHCRKDMGQNFPFNQKPSHPL